MPDDRRTLDALLRLLPDDDPSVSGPVRRRLLEMGEPAEEALRGAVERGEPRLRARARSLLERFRWGRLEREARSLSANGGADLEEGSYLLARFIDSRTRREPCAAELDRLAEGLRARLASIDDPARAAREVARYLGKEERFRGDDKRYYEPANSSLPHVVEERRGLPITLSVVYLLVGRRAAIPLRGVGMPVHFLVRYGADESDLLLDPYGGGRILTAREGEAFLLSRGLPFHPSLFGETPPPAILARMATNLAVAYDRAGDRARSREALRLRAAFSGADPDDPSEGEAPPEA